MAHRAKLADGWASFEPYVTRIVETLKHRAALLDPTRDAYDVCLDQYERGMSAESYDAFFAQVREAVVPLVQEISQRPEPAYAFRSARVGHDAQLAIARDLLELEGLDMAGTSLGEVEHPFSDGFAPGDARVTTHIYETDALSNVFSISTRAVTPSTSRTSTRPMATASSARAPRWASTRARAAFLRTSSAVVRLCRPAPCGASPPRTRRVRRRLGRRSLPHRQHRQSAAHPHGGRRADLPAAHHDRYDIERALFAGEATAADIPGLWRELTQRYLGIEVPSDTLGCLQDTHWSGGDFGYFPSYALGSAYGAQYVAAMARDGVDVDAACAAGDLAPVRAWLEAASGAGAAARTRPS